MRHFKLILSALALLLIGITQPVNAGTPVASNDANNSYFESEGDSVWKMDEALITNASQITSNNSQNGFPPSNLLRPESDGVGTNQYIWHSSWGNPAIPPANTDTYLQVQFNKAETDIIFTMVGSTWTSTYDTPAEVIIQAANQPTGEWKEVAH